MFLRALLDIPEDRTTWLVYADWLEDRGDPRAEFLRLVVARAQMPEDDPEAVPADARLTQLRGELDPRWMAAFDPAPVVVCPRGSYRFCGRVWTELSPTDAPDIRICRECQRPVFYGHTADEAQMIGSCGEAVALSTRVPGSQNPFPPPPTPGVDEIAADDDW